MAKTRVAQRGAPGTDTANADAFQTDLLQTLSVIARSLSAIALRLSRSQFQNDGQRMRFLASFGLDRSAIAGILGTTSKTVSSRLSERPTKRRRPRKPRRGKG